MEFSYNGKLTGEARLNLDAFDNDYEIRLDVPLVISWIAEYPDEGDGIESVGIIGVTVARDGDWGAFEHALLPAIQAHNFIQDEIVEWVNDNYADLMRSDGEDAKAERVTE